MSTYSVTDAAAQFGQLLDEVQRTGEEVILVDGGREVAVIVSVEDYLLLTGKPRPAVLNQNGDQ